MRTISHALTAAAAGILVLSGTRGQAGDGDVFIGNQAAGTDLVLSLEEACPAGEAITLTFLDTRKATVLQMSDPSHRHIIKPGETAILSSGAAPFCRGFRLAAAKGQSSCTFRYSVRVEGGKAGGKIEAVRPAGPEGAFQELDPDTLAFWGADPASP
jgi:hypothetical protein